MCAKALTLQLYMKGTHLKNNIMTWAKNFISKNIDMQKFISIEIKFKSNFYRNQIFALFIHFALRMVSWWYRNVGF